MWPLDAQTAGCPGSKRSLHGPSLTTVASTVAKSQTRLAEAEAEAAETMAETVERPEVEVPP